MYSVLFFYCRLHHKSFAKFCILCVILPPCQPAIFLSRYWVLVKGFYTAHLYTEPCSTKQASHGGRKLCACACAWRIVRVKMLVKKWWFCVSLSPLLVVYGAIFVSCDAVPALSLSRTRIYGPGIHPKRCSLPINYFYIQAIDTEGNRCIILL